MPSTERRFFLSRGITFAACLSLAAVLALGSCSLADYASKAAENEEELPTAIFDHYTHTVVEKGKTRLQLKAAKASIYDTSKRMVLKDVAFSEYDTATGEVDSSGHADEVIYHTDTKDAEFSGDVRLESKKQDAFLEGEYLHWVDKDKSLEGRLDRTVTISRADGSKVIGAGFEADTKKRAFSFRGSVEGRIESDTVSEAKQ
jgi:LPS export ABC transporter protein LptC